MKPEEVEKPEEMMKIIWPMGRFYGRPADTLPSRYLEWVVENMKDEALNTAAFLVLRSRGFTNDYKRAVK